MTDIEYPKIIGEYFGPFVEKNYRLNDFKNFITKLLTKYVQFDTEFIDKFLTEKNLSFLQKAFVHHSYDLDVNYQNLEKFGDKVLKITITDYVIFNRFASITVSETYANLYHNLSDKTYFSKLARDLNFRNYFIFGKDEESKTTGTKDVESNAILKKTLEDTFEAFFGAIFYLWDIQQGFDFALNNCRKFIFNLLNSQKIPLEGDIKNIMMQINEIYPQLGWGQMNRYMKVYTKNGEYNKVWTSFYGFEPDDKDMKKRIFLVEAYGRNTSDSQAKAAEKLLRLFQSKYGIQTKKIEIYGLEASEVEIESPFTLDELSSFLKNFLSAECLILPEYIDQIINQVNAIKLKTVFTKGFYTATINYKKYIFFGERVIEFLNNYLIGKKYFIYSEGIMSPIGTYFTSLFKTNEIFDNYVAQNSFDPVRTKIFQYMKNEKINFYCFIGAIFEIISTSFDFAASILSINNFLKLLFETTEVFISYKKIFDPVTRTKEIYDTWHVNIKDYEEISTLGPDLFKVRLRTPDFMGRKGITIEMTGNNKSELSKKVKKLMLYTLVYKYGVKENYIDPFFTGEKMKVHRNRQR